MMQRALYNMRRVPVTRPVMGMRVATPMIRTNLAIRYNSSKSQDAKLTSEQEANSTPVDAAEATSEAADDVATKTEEASESNEVEDLTKKLAQKDKDLADMKNHYARAIADFRNLQESTKKEVNKAKDFALQKFAKDLLESLDNFSLALNAVKEETLKTNEEVKNLYEGVNMTRNVFEKTLTKHGIEKIDPMGEQFDPNQHEATFELAQPDKEPGTVFHVQQPGYTLNSRVLRPAKVGLVKDPENL